MTHLFYKICTVITNYITGLTGSEMNFEEFVEYFKVYGQVETIVNLITITMIFGIIYAFIRAGIDVYKESKQRSTQMEES